MYGERYGYIDICETGIYNVMCEGNIIPFNYVQALMADSNILLLFINLDFLASFTKTMSYKNSKNWHISLFSGGGRGVNILLICYNLYLCHFI